MKKFYFMIFTALLSIAVACQKSADSDAVPVVRLVKPCDPLKGDMLLTEVSMGSTVAVIGEGLSDVCKIWFNDRPASLNPTMITATSIIVSVPSTMPEVFTNSMILETSTGKRCEYPISVIIPAPSIDRVECLYAPIGSELRIHGKYFFAKENGLVDVTFPGNIPAEVRSVSETMITCVVPEGADISGNLVVESQFGKSRSRDVWRTVEGLFCNAEEPTDVWDDWGRGVFGTENGCSGQYLIINGPVGNWVWPKDNTHIYYRRPDDSPIVSEGEVADYALQFEYLCVNWDCTPFCMWFTTEDGENIDSADAQYHWYGAEDSELVVGSWATKTIPLTDFNTDKDEKETRGIKDLTTLVNFVAMPFGASELAEGQMNVWFDNFRIVRINK